mmetsp:Transcript_69987/g.131690  ORF Transcript_69987/g.131690 Transcript_69987/m.131690 type:complete len:119 (-) Transcript_69987:249-605(-)
MNDCFAYCVDAILKHFSQPRRFTAKLRCRSHSRKWRSLFYSTLNAFISDECSKHTLVAAIDPPRKITPFPFHTEKNPLGIFSSVGSLFALGLPKKKICFVWFQSVDPSSEFSARIFIA